MPIPSFQHFLYETQSECLSVFDTDGRLRRERYTVLRGNQLHALALPQGDLHQLPPWLCLATSPHQRCTLEATGTKVCVRGVRSGGSRFFRAVHTLPKNRSTTIEIRGHGPHRPIFGVVSLDAGQPFGEEKVCGRNFWASGTDKALLVFEPQEKRVSFYAADESTPRRVAKLLPRDYVLSVVYPYHRGGSSTSSCVVSCVPESWAEKEGEHDAGFNLYPDWRIVKSSYWMRSCS